MVEVYDENYVQMIRMNLDGSKEQVLIRYDNVNVSRIAATEYLPYISVSGSLHGDELIIALHRGEDGPDQYYRMKPDGSGQSFIGELKGFNKEESSGSD